LQKDPGFVLAQQIEHEHDDEGEHDSLTRIFPEKCARRPKSPLWPARAALRVSPDHLPESNLLSGK
jgi:hypothetical protein